MSSSTVVPSEFPESAAKQSTVSNPILVATDALAGSEPTGALKAAKLLAPLSQADVIVVTALEPFPPDAAAYGMVLPVTWSEESRRQTVLKRVTDLVTRIAGPRAHWRVELRDGETPNVVARASRELNARVVIVGLGHRDFLDRFFGDETALRTLRASRRPVFAVNEEIERLPRRVVFALDFSEASMYAARTALELFPSFSHVVLAHVAPRLELPPEALAGWSALYREGTESVFGDARGQLDIPKNVTVENVTLEGKPSRALIEYARDSHIDLIVAGSHGAGVIERFLAGSTVTGLLRGASCSILAVPLPRTSAHTKAGAGSNTGLIPPEQWADALSEFTKRNAGRSSSLEVDEPEYGALAQLHDYPLLGVAYDHNDRSVEIMVGDFAGTRRHLTRSISGVERIDLLTDARGRDWVLRFAHGDGQTILTLS